MSALPLVLQKFLRMRRLRRRSLFAEPCRSRLLGLGGRNPPLYAAQGIADLRPFLEQKPEAEELAKEDLLKREAEETAVGGATSAIGISFVLDIFCGRAWHDRVKKGGFKVGTNMKIRTVDHMRCGAAAIGRSASVHNRRKCVSTGYGRKTSERQVRKLAAMLESNRRCAKNVLCVNIVRLFIPTDACCWCARTMLVKLLEALPKSGAGGGRACSESCRAAPAAGSQMAHSAHLAMRRSGTQAHTRVRWTYASPAQQRRLGSAKCGCTCSKTFRSGACGGQFSIGQAAGMA